MHRRCARCLRRIIVIILLLVRVLSLKLLRIVALLLHRHRGIASRYTRRIDSSAGGIVLSLRRLTGRRSVVARMTVAIQKEGEQANETKSDNASDCASRNGTHGSAAFAAVGIGSG